MVDAHLSVAWDGYQNNICNGLSQLQQRGEFVDMTLAADGHHVKVHQMIMSLVSPYIKELISSAQCPHPVVFLNNISYATLCAILEYVYTGEAIVPRERLADVIEAAKALHIKGLINMDISKSPQSEETRDPIPEYNVNPQGESLVDKLREHMENKKHNVKIKKDSPTPIKIFIDVDTSQSTEVLDDELMGGTEIPTDLPNTSVTNIETEQKTNDNNNGRRALDVFRDGKSVAQYSISNQGGLQLICNRYIYTLKYVQKKLLRFWRCVDSSYKKCPANIYTNEKNEIVKRRFTHNHPFHDQKILKKIRLGIVYSAFSEAETEAIFKKTGTKEKERTAGAISQDTDSE